VPSPDNQSLPDGFHQRKISQRTGRLLFRGWILVWPPGPTPDPLPERDAALVKLSPGALFSRDVQYALFIDQSFTVSPSISDIYFLVSEMRRAAWPARIVKRKTPPKAKFLLPAEPERRAVVLLSELKYQESSDADRLAPGTKITVYEATRFMRFERGEEPLGKEPLHIKAQREFYERFPSLLNRETMRSSSLLSYKFDMAIFGRGPGGHTWGWY